MSTLGGGEIDITSRDVLEELKCPVCVEFMMPPIPMCQNGHNVCNTCRQKVNQCPTCKVEFLESRCWILENIIQKIKYRCQYYVNGCDFVSTAQFIKSHEAECPDRPFNCPFAVVVTKNFCWKGHIHDMWDHILCQHRALAEAEGKIFILTVDCAEPGLLHQAVDSSANIFFIVWKVIDMDLYCCVLYVGPETRASSYSYCMTIESTDGSAYATVCLPAKSYFVDVETLFRNRDCAVFSYVLWNRCRRELSSNKVSLQVEIEDNGQH